MDAVIDIGHLAQRCATELHVVDTLGGKTVSVLFDGGDHLIFPDPERRIVGTVMGPLSVCHDIRQLRGPDFEQEGPFPWDVCLLHADGDGNLNATSKAFLAGSICEELDMWVKRLAAHVKACRTAKIDLEFHHVADLVPPNTLRGLLRARGMAIMALYGKWVQGASEEDRLRYGKETLPFARALQYIERNGICVDIDYVTQQLGDDHSQHAAHFFRSVANAQRNGFVLTRFNPVGGRTGRVRVASGFNCMGIPHGPPRRSIISRFEGGLVYSFDFNAIDYRCIIASIDDPGFRELYADCDDFHARTASFLFRKGVDPAMRDAIKQLTYVSVYGGSEETVSEKTGLSIENVRWAMERLNRKLNPVMQLRESLGGIARTLGYVTLPDGRRVTIEPGSHDGKVLGLYAQSYSSWVFEQALKAVVNLTLGWRSRVIFPVHDELVVDVHPDEIVRDVEIRDAMEWATGEHLFRVNTKRGASYADATDA